MAFASLGLTMYILSGVAVLPFAARGDDSYEQCPFYPQPVPLAGSSLPETINNALDAVDRLYQNVSKSENISMIVTVVYDQEQIWTKGYGKANVFDPKSGLPTGENLLRVASITKTFTSQLLMLMRDQGTVHLDDEVAKYYPEFSIQSPYATRNKTTLRQLASHTSGIPRDLHYPCGFNPNCTDDDVLSTIKDMHLVVEPYTRFHYSNIGFGLLGRVLGKVANVRYEDLLQHKILNPIGMHSSTFSVNASTRSRMAVGVNSDGSRAQIDELGWESPAGGLLASADDMAKYLMHLFSTSSSAGPTQLLDGTTVSESLATQILLRDGSSAVGLPWEMKYSSGIWMKSKQGELSGFRSSISLVEPLKLGVFVSALRSEVSEKSVWSIPALDILVPSFVEYLSGHQPSYKLPLHHKQFVGKYYFNSSVWVNETTGVLEGSIFGDLFNFTAVLDKSMNPPVEIPNVLKVHPIETGVGCRWLDDGTDQEYIYFDNVTSSDFGTPAYRFRFMGSASHRFPAHGHDQPSSLGTRPMIHLA